MVKPKVLITSTNADLAGAPVHVLTLVARLKAEFDFVAVFGEDGPIRQSIQQLGIATFVIPSLRSSINPVSDLRCLWAYIKLVRSERPDLLHAHSSKAGMIARWAGFVLGIPTIYTVHGWGFGPGRSRLQSAFVYCVERMFSFLSSFTSIFVSEADRLIGIRRIHLNPHRCKTIHNGVVDHGSRADVKSASTVIMAARVCHAKNHDLLLQSFQQCNTAFKLVLVGEGTDSENFREKVANLAPGKTLLVECIGLSNQVPALLAQAGVFVLCSRYEGLPLSIIEAMCAGLPVVATNVGGVSELVEDGVTGYLVPPNDMAALSKCLDVLGKDADLRLCMGQAGRLRYQSLFSDYHMAQKTSKCYRETIGCP